LKASKVSDIYYLLVDVVLLIVLRCAC